MTLENPLEEGSLHSQTWRNKEMHDSRTEESKALFTRMYNGGSSPINKNEAREEIQACSTSWIPKVTQCGQNLQEGVLL